MITYLKAHEKMMLELLSKNDERTDWKKISDMHERKIRYFQHERLIHLLVMITTTLAALLSFFFTFASNMPAFFILTLVLLILSIAYVVHYFKLENGVQRLYRLSDKLEEKIK
jgi:amino acid transporter